jgi:hypothetical protein
MVETLPQMGVLRVVPPAKLEAALAREAKRKAQIEDADTLPEISDLGAFIRTQYEMFRNHRNDMAAGWSQRLLTAMRAFNGTYDPTKLAEIRKFGGSEVYARLIAMKCRGASSLLRDVYLSPERSWGLEPPADPDVPEDIVNSVNQFVQAEIGKVQAAGAPVGVDMIRDRVAQLMEGAREAAKKKARKQSQIAEDKIEELLEQGGFYKALAEFLVDIPIFPFACIKGPVVKIVPTVAWTNGQASVEQKPRLFWNRVSPFDLWWTPGVADIEDAAVIEKTRISRADLNDLLDLPGYNHDAIRAVLDEYGSGGLADNWDSTDTERAILESRENPFMNRSGMITCLEFHGNVQGRMLLQYGMPEDQIEDELRDYFVQAWLIGNHVIKVQLSPSPRKRHPYFITSFEKVPGTPLGNGLTDILADIQEACNATLRALINNLSISSGPQVVVNAERLAPNEDGEEMYPWKRWFVQNDPLSNSAQPPISFFMPTSNAQEMMGVYQWLNGLADDISAIPKYATGGGAGAGAGRTASGLSMLMNNASKILQTVAANIDRDVFGPLLQQLFDMLMLTDTSGLLSGEEQVKVMGVAVAVQRETQRSRQLEFLQITANPVDMQIVGPKGRAAILRAVSHTIGLDGEEIVPSEEELDQQQAQAAAAAQQQGMPGHAGMGEQAAAAQGAPAPKGGNVTQDMGPRTNIAGGVG